MGSFVAPIGAVLCISLLGACDGKISDLAPDTPVRPGPIDFTDPAACDGVERTVTSRTGTRRLNREELAHTVRELFGDVEGVSTLWPADVIIDGYDTNAEGLSTSDEHARSWFDFSEELAARAVAGSTTTEPVSLREEAEAAGGTYCPDASAGGFANLCFESAIFHDFTLGNGEYRVSVRAYGAPAGGAAPHMVVRVDGATLIDVDVAAPIGAPEVYAAETPLAGGVHRVEVAFTNDFYDDTVVPIANRDLHVDWIEVASLDSEPAPLSPIMSCDPADSDADTCTREILGNFARRAWRRPVSATEVDELAALAAASRVEDGFADSIALGIQAILLSPYFIFRVEDQRGTPEMAAPLSGDEMASRLAYALYRLPPDQALLEAGASGRLTDDAMLAAEVRRMLADERASGFADSFVHQWLEIERLEELDRDGSLYPNFAAVAPLMESEAQSFFGSVLASGTVFDLIDADYTFVNQVLAEHYGLPGTFGSALQRVTLSGERPGGVLGLGAVLTSTGKPAGTSVVLRGKFVLDRLLCRAPPPPPATAEAENETIVDLTASSRTQSEQRRAEDSCASCHSAMDPIGLAFEGFGATGATRSTDDNGFPVDPSGEIRLGSETISFDGPEGLIGLIRERPEMTRCFTSQLVTYMAGRSVRTPDRCMIEDIVDQATAQGDGLSDYVLGVATSPLFRSQVAAVEDSP